MKLYDNISFDARLIVKDERPDVPRGACCIELLLVRLETPAVGPVSQGAPRLTFRPFT